MVCGVDRTVDSSLIECPFVNCTVVSDGPEDVSARSGVRLSMNFVGLLSSLKELPSKSQKLVGRSLSRVLHSEIENHVGNGAKKDGDKQENYSNYLAKDVLIIIGLFLIVCSFKGISYAVDARWVSIVFLLFFLQAGGVAALLYVVGFFSALSH